MPRRLADAHPWSMSVEGADDLQTHGMSLVCEAFWHSMDGDFDQARYSWSSRAGLGLGSAPWRFREEELGTIEMYAGEPVAAERAFRKNYTLFVETGDEGHASTAAAELARSLCWLGRYDEAEETTRASRAKPHDDLVSQVLCRSAQALILAARGDLDRAERMARDSVAMFAEAQTLTSRAISGWISPRCSGGGEAVGCRGRDTSGAGALRAQRKPAGSGTSSGAARRARAVACPGCPVLLR